jgi:transcriptional regulator with XRE-family HTH domain
MAHSRRGRPPNPLDPSASRAARLGAEIRSRRQARGLTLEALAALIGFSAQHISEAERAKAPVSEPFVGACDHALDAGGSLLKLLPAVVYDRATERHGRSVARRQAARSSSVVVPRREMPEARAVAGNEVEPGFATEPRRIPSSSHDSLQKSKKPDAATPNRDTEQSSVLDSVDRVVEPSYERLRYALQHPTTVDLPAVAQLRDRLWDLDVLYVRAPSTSLLADTGRCLGDIGFLQAHARESRVGQQLCGAEAEAATLMGQLVWDASQRREHAAARAYLHQAIHAARASGNPTAEGRALLRMSMVALYGEKNPKSGLALAAQAVKVTTATSEVIGGLAMLHAAEAHAMLGRRPECDRALSRASFRFDRITATDPAIELFSPTQLGRLAGSCYLSLGDNRRALSLLQTTAHALRDGSKAQAIVLGNLALAQLRLGELDAATYAIHEAIDVIELTRGAGGLNIVFSVAQELRPWRRLPVVQDVYDRLLTLMATR